MDVKTNVTQDAAVRLMLKFPYWSELYYTMTVYQEDRIPTLCTDGVNMWVNPAFWASLSLEHKVAALAHEVGHKMLLHCSRRGARDPYLWNVAADYVVNGILAQNGFSLKDDWLQKDEYIGWSVEAVYSDLESKATKVGKPNYGQGGKDGKSEMGEEGAPSQPSGEQGDGGADSGDGDTGGTGEDGAPNNGQSQSGPSEGDSGGDGSGSGQGNSVTYNVPGVPKSWNDKYRDIKDMQGSKETVDKIEKEVMDAVEKAIMTAKAHGNVPGGMEAYDDLMQPSKEPWYNHLHRYMQSLSMSEYNWARINRRQLVQHQLFTPDHYSEALESVAFAIDCSGSVFGPAEQANFAGHVNAILAEAKPNKTHVLYFDAIIQRHDELDYGCLDFHTRPKGGGGTDFRPIFEKIEEEGVVPEILVILTDCYGSFPEEAPPYPVIWASIIDPEQLGGYLPPFGETIFVE